MDPISLWNFPFFIHKHLLVVYFDQRLGDAHPKRWSKKSFSAFFVLKSFKNATIWCKIKQKTSFLLCTKTLVDWVFLRKSCFLGIKHSTSYWCKLKKLVFLLDFASNFCIFLAFLYKKCWKLLFRPAFGVHSTKGWLKYTTPALYLILK